MQPNNPKTGQPSCGYRDSHHVLPRVSSSLGFAQRVSTLFPPGAGRAQCWGPCPAPESSGSSGLKVLQPPPTWRLELGCWQHGNVSDMPWPHLSQHLPFLPGMDKERQQPSHSSHPQLGQPQAQSPSTDKQPVLVLSCYRRLPWLNSSLTPTGMFTSRFHNYV